MIEMTRSASGSLLGSEFDDFLYASICEEKNGMLLSVLSALARLDLDPWQEAAELARLPGEAAIQRLASLIATLPDGRSAQFDSGTTAARLVARLPHRPGSNIPQRDTASMAGTSESVVMGEMRIPLTFIDMKVSTAETWLAELFWASI